MAKYPLDSNDRVANVVNLAPCVVPTFYERDDDHEEERRLLGSGKEVPRGLAAITEEFADTQGR